MAISSRLVEKMGGCIWAESQPGVGSAFHFTADFRRATGEASSTLTGQPAIVSGRRVLVVDDNATNRLILEEMLRAWNMQVTPVSGPREGLEAVRQANGRG